MKKITIIFLAFIVSTTLYAQTPNLFNYQGVARDLSGNPIINQSIGLRISILQGSATGIEVYKETLTITTNNLGLFNIQIGGGTPVTGTIGTINWSNATYYLKIEMDESGGTDYQFMGTSQLISVPYALHSKTSEAVTNETQTLSLSTNELTISGTNGNKVTFTNWDTNANDDVTITGNQSIAGIKTFTGTISASNKVITNVATPVAALDAANKSYVDASKTKVFGQGSNVGTTFTIPDNVEIFTTGDGSWNSEIILPVPTQANNNLYNRIGTFLLIRCRSSFSFLLNNTNSDLPNSLRLNYGQSSLFVYDGDMWLKVVASNNLASLQTSEVSAITETTASCGGGITSEGGSSVTARGVCWSTSEKPTIVLTTKTIDGSGTGGFISSITGLTANTSYYVRAYATNSYGTIYGNQWVFKTFGASDVDGNLYRSVTIGTQVWMTENLKTTKYRDGTAIPNITDFATSCAATTPAYCWYNNDITNKVTYGALYNWYAIDKTSNGNKDLCPTGWHVPSDAEWTTLTTYLGGESVAGGKLKETGTTHWNSPNNGATDEYGFRCLPAGFRTCPFDENFKQINEVAVLWSKTVFNSNAAMIRVIYSGGISVINTAHEKRESISIRCLKD